MVGTLVRGSRKIRLATGVAHLAAAAVVAAAVGLLLAAAGDGVPAAATAVLLAIISAAYLGAELEMWPMPVPQTRKQVPSVWRYRYPQPVTAAMYGSLLAPGVGTMTATPVGSG